LAVSAALFDDAASNQRVSAVPNALILVSPAVDLEKDNWPQRLLGARANVKTISPVAHVRAGMPPAIILEGSEDTVTPLAGVYYRRSLCVGFASLRLCVRFCFFKERIPCAEISEPFTTLSHL
jgi:hypothetical protein